MLFKFARTASPPIKTRGKKVLLLIDWDNLFISLINTFGVHISLEERLEKMLLWIKQEVGELWAGFVFAPEHLNILHQELCVRLGFKLFTCPKRRLPKPKRNSKTGLMEEEEDTVDETIIWLGTHMMDHPDIGFICLVSSDSDFIPFLEEAALHDIKRVLVIPSSVSLGDNKGKKLISLSDYNDKKKRMILHLDSISVAS